MEALRETRDSLTLEANVTGRAEDVNEFTHRILGPERGRGDLLNRKEALKVRATGGAQSRDESLKSMSVIFLVLDRRLWRVCFV